MFGDRKCVKFDSDRNEGLFSLVVRSSSVVCCVRACLLHCSLCCMTKDNPSLDVCCVAHSRFSSDASVHFDVFVQ